MRSLLRPAAATGALAACLLVVSGCGTDSTPSAAPATATPTAPASSTSAAVPSGSPTVEVSPGGYVTTKAGRVIDPDPTYAAAHLEPFADATVVKVPGPVAEELHREYGTWLRDITFRPEVINARAARLPASAFKPAATKMTARAAADWWGNVDRRRTEDAQGNLMALMYHGYHNQPATGGPRVVNVAVTGVRMERNRTGTIRFSATVTGQLRSRKAGRPVRWPYENKVDLTLVQDGGSWKVDAWSGAYRYLDVIWER